MDVNDGVLTYTRTKTDIKLEIKIHTSNVLIFITI